MPQPPPSPAKYPDQSSLAGLPPDGMKAMQAALQAIRRGDAGEVLRLTGEVLGLVPGHPEALRLAGIAHAAGRSEEQTSELQSIMRIAYAVIGLKKKNKEIRHHKTETN